MEAQARNLQLGPNLGKVVAAKRAKVIVGKQTNWKRRIRAYFILEKSERANQVVEMSLRGEQGFLKYSHLSH